MKLHLPKTLRSALLACFASVAGLTSTIATGAMLGGAFYVSLTQEAQAEDVAVTTDTVWSNADAATHADDTVTVDGGDTAITLQVGNGNTNALTAGSSIDFGTVTVNEGGVLKLHVWTAKSTNNLAEEMVTINSAITLNNAGILLEDGAYNFAESITIKGESTLAVNWEKGTILTRIEGDESAVFKLVRNGNENGWDSRPALIELTEANTEFKGTVKLDDQFAQYDGEGLKLVISNAEALINAILDMGENDDVALRIRTQQAILKAIKGHGFIEYTPLSGQASTTEIVVSIAEGDYAGTSAANVNWTITGGNQGLSNASILGTYTVGESASSTFEGAITLGALVNNSAAGIDVTNMTGLTIANVAAAEGATLNLGKVTGYTAGHTFDYGSSWQATWQDDGTATLTDTAIAWVDAGAEGDTDINWSTADNWSSAVAPTATDYVRLVATEGVTRTIALTADATVAGLRVYDAYTLSVGEGNTAALTATQGVQLYGETAGLSKAGKGTLSMTSAQAIAAKMNVTEGTLKLTDVLASAPLNGITAQDLTALRSSASGVLAVTAGGAAGTPGASANNAGRGPTVSAISLADSFTGTVEVLGGKLSVTKSLLGGASLIKLNGGGLLVSSSGSAFAAQELAYNLHVGDNGGYLDHYGASTAKEDSWSSKHTGSMTGSGALSLIGYGEWVFAGHYADFTGSIRFGSQAQRVYLSSDMPGLTGLLATATEVVVGYKSGGDSAVSVSVSGKETLSGNRTIYFANGSTFTHTGGVEVAAGQTLSVQRYPSVHTGTFNVANVELAAGSGDTVAAVLSVGAGIEVNLTDTSAYTATAGTIAVAAGATVNDSRALTIDGAYTISGAGAYNQLGSLELTSQGALTLSGVVSIASLAGKNDGTITLSDTLTSLRLGDFAIGTEYAIGDVADGGTKNWNALLGYDARQYSIEYTNGVLTSEYMGDIVWASPADEDVAWGGTDNWQVAGNSVSVAAADEVLLPTLTDGLSSTIAITADTTVAKVTVQGAYNFFVAEGVGYSFDAGSIVPEQGGSLGKVGAGTLRMSLADAVAARMTVTEGTLSISDTIGGDSVNVSDNSAELANIVYDADLTALSGGGTLAVTLSGGKDSNVRSTLKLTNAFTGTLEVQGGNLDRLSALGGTTLVRLNNGGLYSREPLAGNHQFTQAIEVQGTSWLRHQGNSGSDNTYYTELAGSISGSGTLQVYEVGDWHFCGDMGQFTGGMDMVGQANVYIKSDATALASLKAADGSLLNVSNNSTLTTALTSTSGTANLGAESGSTLNLGAVTIGNGSTLKLEGGGTHTATSVNMGAAATALTLGANTSLTVTGALNGDKNVDTETLTITLGENAHLVLQSTDHTQTFGSTVSIVLGANSVLEDSAVRRLGNSSLNITGSGVYKLKALQLSNGANADTSVTIGAGATLHITGTDLTHTGDGGSLLTGTNNNNNTITVRGTLALDCGVSRYSNDDTANTINVESGGKIAFNRGLTAANEKSENATDIVKDIINIKDGAVLEVSSSSTTVTGTNKVAVNIENNAIVMGGNAGETTESKIVNNLVFNGGAYIGAKADTTLTIAPADNETGLKWLDIIGTADTQGLAQGAGGKVVFASAVTSEWNVNVLAGAEADFQGGLTINGVNNGEGLHNAGTLTLNGAAIASVFENTSAATLKGVVSFGRLNNSGSIDLAATTSLALGDFSMTEGTTYNVGALTGLSDTHTIGSLLGAGVGHTVTYDEQAGTISVDSHLVWNAQAATEGDNVWNATNSNWQYDAAASAFKTDQKVIFAALDGVNTTVELGDNVTADSILLTGAYNFSVAEGSSYSLTTTHGLAKEGSFTKVGGGTLIMSNADALAAGVSISAGALQLSDTQGNTVNSGNILPGASNTTTWQESGLLVDLSGISAGAAGTLQLTLAGRVNDGNDSTRLQLAENFAGKVEVLGGQLGHASSLGGATQVILNGGGIVFNNDGDEANNNSTVFATPVHVASDSTGALRAWGSYSALAAAVSSLTGDETATLQKYDDGAIRLNELSGFAGKVEIHQGKISLNDTTESATLSSLYMVAGTQLVLEDGQHLTVKNLAEGAYIDLNGASSLTIESIDSKQNGTLDFEGDVAARASFAVAQDEIYTLAHDGLTLGTLTNAGAGTLKLKGAVSLGDLYNASGIIDLADVTALSISNMQYAIGAEYHVGQFSGVETDAFLALIGNGGNSFLSASYDEATGMVSFNASTYWKDDGADGNNVWADATNWSTGDSEGFSLANTTVKLGAEAQGRNILLQSDVEATTTVHVAEAYTFSVAADESYTFNGTLQYAGDQVQALTKAGEGTLTVSLAQAMANGGMHIEEGRLVVLGDVTTADNKNEVGGFNAFNVTYDLTALSSSADGILSVSLFGHVANNALDGSELKFADDFTGALEITHGSLLIRPTAVMGGISKIRLDGGGVALYNGAALALPIEVGADGAWIFGRLANAAYSGAVTGVGNLTLVVANNVDDLTFSGSITLGDYSVQDENGVATTAKSNLVKKGGSIAYITGEDNNINITGGVIAEAGQLVFRNQQRLNSLAVNGNSTVTLEKNAAIGSLTLNNGTLVVGTDDVAAEVSFTDTAARIGNNSTTRKVTLKGDSSVTDAAYWQLTGGSLTLEGAGSYTIAGMGLSAGGAQATTLNVEQGVHLHVTGTTNDSGKNTGAFSLAHWNNRNTVNVRGVLELESGISTYSGYTSEATINVENGGKLAFNNGLTAAGKDNAVTINVAGGATLQVSGTGNTGTNLVNVNIDREAIIMGGDANGATETIISNDLLIVQGFYAGAVAGTTLHLAPESGSLDTACSWIDVLGEAEGAGGTVVFDVNNLQLNALNVHAGGKAVINSDADLQDTNGYGSVVVDGTLSFDSAGIITLNEAIQLGADGTVEFLNTADTKLVLSDALLTENNPGLSMTWTLIDTTAGGTLTGWDMENLDITHFLLNGETPSFVDWDGYSVENGKLTLHMLVRYWDATGEGAIWNTTDANWRPTDGSADTNVFETNSRVTFTDTDEGKNVLYKNVKVVDTGVHAKSIVISGSDYVFSGGNVLVDQSISATQDTRFESALVIGSSAQELDINVGADTTLTVGVLETLSEVKNGVSVYLQGGGSFRKTGEGILNITDGVQGIINSAVVEFGSLQLGDSASLSVGSNTIIGGSLQNVGIYAEGSVIDFTSGQAVTTTNVIESADGVNMAVLTGVNLNAGSALAYASIQKVTFAGESTLSGYITFEETKHQREMAVATGGTLAVQNLTFDLHGLSIGTKVLIENGEVADAADAYKGIINGWDSITLTYSGVAVNADSVDTSVAGVVTIKEDGGDLFWDGLSNGAAAADWNASSLNWSTTAGTDGTSVYLALSDTYFGATPEGAARDINVAHDMVANRIYITQAGYSFAGYRVATLSDMTITTDDAGAITFNNELVVQGALAATVAGELNLGGTTTVVGATDITAKALNVTGDTVVYGNLNISSGSTATGDAGSFTIGTGVRLSAANISLHVDAGAASDTDYTSSKVTADGDINTTGALRITGNATKDFNGVVKADTITVDTGDRSNAVSFNSVSATTMTVTDDSTVNLETAGASGIGTIQLAGTLGYITFAGNYSGYNVVTTSADANVNFASITTVTLSSLSGTVIGTDAEGNDIYGSIAFGDGYRNLNINKLSNVQNLHIGQAEYGATLNNATGGIHGNLSVASGAGLTVNSNNIMANGQGAWDLSGLLKLGGTAQTLAGNTLYLSGALISGNAAATGLDYTEDAMLHYTAINTISANVNVAEGKTLTIASGKTNLDSVEISGKVSGSGHIVLTGDGTVVFAGANDYTGQVTVEGLVALKVANNQALSHATLNLEADGLLLADIAALGAPAEIGMLNLVASGPVTLDAETRTAGILQLHSLVATDVASATDAAFLVSEMSVSNAQTLDLLLSFEEGMSLQTMKTYNLFTADASYSLADIAESLNLELYVAFGANQEHVARNQYKIIYDEESNVISIRTMLGNIWSGGADLAGDGLVGDGIWSTDNTDKNWSNKDYSEASGFNSAIFVDLEEHDGQLADVIIQGTVTPGDIYFEADTTYYNLKADADDALLAADTNIHKAGSGMVYLSLANNGTMEHAIGNVDLQAGIITLSKDLAVSGEVQVAADAHLRAFASVGGKLVTAGYTASGVFSGVTMGQDAISGMTDADGNVSKGLIASQDIYTQVTIEGKADAPVLLENVTLASYGSADSLTNVAIGQNVDVTGYYTLNGHVHFNDTLINSGTVTLQSDMTAEIGKLAYTFTVDANGASQYVYQLVQGGQINGMGDLTVQDLYINGVNLSAGLADGVATVYTGNDGSLTLSIGNVTARDENGNVTVVDGTVGMPKWDERWQTGENEVMPGLSRRYAGTDAAAVVTFAEGVADDDDYYYYSAVVNEDNANAVNGSTGEVVVTLSAASVGSIAASGAAAGDAEMEMWLYDRSGFDTVIAGRYSEAYTTSFRQGGDTHLLINTDARHTNLKTWVVGGSWNAEQDGSSHVTLQTGNVLNLVGGTYGANQRGSTAVFIDGGRVYEVFAGAYNGSVASTTLTITGGTLGGQTPEGTQAYFAGTKSIYGGSYNGAVLGDVVVTVDGDATITNLVGGGYAGTVEGDITLNLLNGTATMVNAAGIGNATAKGDVLVNLYDEFNITELYGGKQSGSGATVQGSATLAFVEEGVSYDMSGKKIHGFDTISLADGTVVNVSTVDGFATDSTTGLLTISGAGMLNLTGDSDIARDITLVNGATLWFNSDFAGNAIGGEGNNRARRTLTATAGTTIDITGQPKSGDGLCVRLDLTGYGVDDKGALYKGLQDTETSPSGKVALPRVTLSDSASVNAEDNIYFIDYKNEESEIYLNGHTLTKIGDKDLVLYNSTVKDNTNANAVVDGTIFVKEGTLGTNHGMRAAKTNIVLAEGASLDVLEVGGTDVSTIIGALSGSGATNLARELTIATDNSGSYGIGSDFMDTSEKYNQFSSGAGFSYGVYSGAMSGAGALNVTGDGTQYLAGSESSFTGGTHLHDSATLYLMGSTEGSSTKGNSSATGGVLGTGFIAWESADATLYLGNGVQIFNNGTTNVSGSTMVIGVEAAPKGDKLTNYVGANSVGANGALTYITLDGVEYVEVATHNLSSISCDGKYADGTAYMAGTLIDRNKMLLVSRDVWETDTATVSGFSEGGYNTATYSGVLQGMANLEKVGLGTLILDQMNTYTGSTIISAGSLVLKGWAQIGGNKTSAAFNVEQNAGSSLMLAYDGTYGDEITGISNDISINGTGDVRWTTETATGKDTAALISTIGSGVNFTLSGDISGDGNLLHAGAGILVLSGDSTYTGGTHATTGVVEVQSAKGLGNGKVVVDATADLHATVETDTTAPRLTTAISAAGSSIKGDVVINGTADTERVLSMNTAGYESASTTLNDTGTFLVNGAAVQANTNLLKGTGTLAVSDATGQGAMAQANALMDFTGDFVVEGDNAKIAAKQGNFSGGSMAISGQNAKVTLAGTVNIAYGKRLDMRSTGQAAAMNNTAATLEASAVSLASGATLSVSNAKTSYDYNLSGLQAAASAAVGEMLTTVGAGANITIDDNGTHTSVAANGEYMYHFDADRALNGQASGMVSGGLTLNGGSRYEEHYANISLAGGTLTLDTSGGKIALDLLTPGNVKTYDDGFTSQMVLFTDVSSFTLDGTAYGEANAIMMMAAADGELAAGANTIYSTLASNYFTGWNITNETYLVYDVGAGVVYLDKAVPEPTTTTLSLLALAALVARRRRK